jgi:hypothetical protein
MTKEANARVLRSHQLVQQLAYVGMVAALICLAGCGSQATEAVASPSRLHTLEAKNAYAVAYDSRGRGAYVSVLSANSEVMKVCAEPSPDASANLSSKLASEFSANATATLKAIQAAAGVTNKANEEATAQIVDVAQRTELVLVLRESLYRLCELNLNGVLKNEQAVLSFEQVMRTTRQLAQRDIVGKLVATLEKVLESQMAADEKTLLAGTVINAILTMSAVEIAAKSNDSSVADAAAAVAIGKALGDSQRFETLLKNMQDEKKKEAPKPPPPPSAPKK